MIITVYVYIKKVSHLPSQLGIFVFTFTVKRFHIYGALLHLALKVFTFTGPYYIFTFRGATGCILSFVCSFVCSVVIVVCLLLLFFVFVLLFFFFFFWGGGGCCLFVFCSFGNHFRSYFHTFYKILYVFSGCVFLHCAGFHVALIFAEQTSMHFLV